MMLYLARDTDTHPQWRCCNDWGLVMYPHRLDQLKRQRETQADAQKSQLKKSWKFNFSVLYCYGAEHAEHWRQRSEQLKRHRETNKIYHILTNLHSLPYDPEANWLPSFVANSWHWTSLSPYEFIPCLQFEGSKPGFVFKRSQLGTGSYLDSPDASARAGSGGDGYGQEDAHDGRTRC